MTSNYPPELSPLLRLTPLSISDLPPHPDLAKDLPKLKDGEDSNQPDLLPFITTLLNDGLAFLSKAEITANFRQSGIKKAEGSTADVEILSRTVKSSTISSQVAWHNANANATSSRKPSKAPTSTSINDNSTSLSVPDTTSQPRSRSASVASLARPKIRRPKPTSIPDEHWFTRRSIHEAKSSKLSPGTASWEQFLFGLLHEHSVHEQDFTPTLFDAHPVVNWDGQVRKLAEEGGLRREGWMDVNCSVFEMCHDLPGMLGPRCFGVCVVGGRVVPEQGMAAEGTTSSATAATSGDASQPAYAKRWHDGEKQKFVVVTVPVDLNRVKASFYGSGKNAKEGADAKQKSSVVQGLYAAVETCTLRDRVLPSGAPRQADGAGDAEGGEEEVEWIMATASDAKGNLPMMMQKMAMPGQLPKDVSHFMKWIRDVDEEEVEKALAGFE